MNFFRIFFRNIQSNKIPFILSILSLSIGFSVSFIIYLWIESETGFDKFNKNLKDIFLVQIEEKGQNSSIQTPLPLGPALVDELSEIEYYTSYAAEHKTLETRKLKAKVHGATVDTSFFHIFNFPLISGSLNGAFKSPDAIIITQKMASLFFDGNPIGEIIKLDNDKNYQVAAIMDDVPGNSSISFEFLLIRDRTEAGNWRIWFPAVFVKLKNNIDIDAFSNKIRKFPGVYERKEREVSLFPYSKVHFNLEDRVFFGHYTEWVYIQAMGIVAVLILVLTCLNFINMSIVLYSGRSKEIGLKKVLGCGRPMLIKQFIYEIMFQGALALLVGVLLISLVIHYFGHLASNDMFNNVGVFTLFLFVVLGLVLVFLTSIYPAFFLSSFSPNEILRDFKQMISHNHFFKRTLIIVQFTITCFVIFCTLVVMKQMNFVKEKDLGYVTENLIAVPMEGDEANSKNQAIKQELSHDPNILHLSRGSIRYIYFEDKIINWDNRDQLSDKEFVKYYPASASHGFDITTGLKIKEGRFFSPEFNDDLNVVVNEEAVRQLGLENPIGSKFKTGSREVTIVGVVENFNYASVANIVQPVVFSFSDGSDMFIRIKPGVERSVINHLEQVFEELLPAHLLEYRFMADHVDEMYQDENQLETIFLGLSLICVLISVLGLFSFSSVIIQEKSKTIAIKKILGANISGIIIGLTSSFVIWAFISYLVAVPIGFNIMNSWLENYAYHSDVTIGIFFKTILIIILVVVAAVIINVLKVSLKRPVEVIRRS